MAKGDHFFVWRHRRGMPFQHHGIDLGDDTVVHFTDGDGGVAGPGALPHGATASFEIKRTPMDEVTRGGRDALHLIEYRRQLSPEAVVRRALSQVGRRGYHLVFDNCEHFACWCILGRSESRQIDIACERFGSATTKAIAAGTIRVVSRVGTPKLIRGASPWILAADAAQWITEAGGHHVGLRDPQRRKQAGRAVGMATALGVGAVGGPVGMAVSGGLWAVGEVVGEVSRNACGRMRQKRAR